MKVLGHRCKGQQVLRVCDDGLVDRFRFPFSLTDSESIGLSWVSFFKLHWA